MGPISDETKKWNKIKLRNRKNTKHDFYFMKTKSVKDFEIISFPFKALNERKYSLLEHT